MRIVYLLMPLYLAISVEAKEISLSFDDAPRRNTQYFTGKTRTSNILLKLKKAGVERAAFYVNTNRLDRDSGLERVKKYKEAGHLIGNHTHSHINIRENSVEDYKKDFDLAHKKLSDLALLDFYFRYPFLRRGKNINEVREIHDYILGKGYTDAFVTVDNYDFYMDKIFQDAVTAKKKVNIDNLRKFYVETLMKGVKFYSELAKNSLKKEVKHVLLLHENDLAALFIDDLVLALKRDGWKIVTPEQSYSDPVTAVFPSSTLIHGQGRVVALAVENGYQGPLNSGLEDTRVLDKLFKEYKVIK